MPYKVVLHAHVKEVKRLNGKGKIFKTKSAAMKEVSEIKRRMRKRR